MDINYKETNISAIPGQYKDSNGAYREILNGFTFELEVYRKPWIQVT